ncbi:twin-arginine translocase subunit TatC [Pelosinus sp. IPA-1]|uniref:twin-arginine translocase subunit TatC n=1 Tax=Pelosinus sp. IPA-1 TaxID=3029569 RepID=UPI0024361568|nr:twin-arginine translocase subunit TatC [Pelosinus sp. IPA-1]GMB01873.1 Sec-independent protein translocase protein TatC [Pelosinus sp. IPA-1]
MAEIVGNEKREEQLQEDPIENQMSLVDHLEELRRRLIIIIMAVAVGSMISYFFAAELVQYITAPAGKLYYMSPAEAFFTYLRVSLFAGFLLALPIVLYQIWAFVVPALTSKERMASVILIPSSVLLFFIGLAFSYFLVLPAGIKFFMGFATENLQPLLSLGEYLSFVISFLLPFGFIFELPLFIVVMAKFGLIGSAFLTGKRKHVMVLSFVVGAVFSPTPDVFSQTMVAIPVIVLYEVSIFIVKYILRK